MPRGDGTGPAGIGAGIGIGRQAGAGRGRMGGPSYAGPGGYCICPKCGERVQHLRGESCAGMKCPKCGAAMIRE